MRNRNYIITLLFISFFIHAHAQIKIQGSVVDVNKMKLPYVAVTLQKMGDSEIKAYTFSKEDGRYNIETTDHNIILSYSLLGFKTYIDTLYLNHQKLNLILDDIILRSNSINLNEVIVQAKRAIRVKKDTVLVQVNNFADGSETTVEDLLRKIPGLQVSIDGTIKVGNKEIEKLMVDGDDFFDRGYKILSKNMPAHVIEEIEILNNYSNNKLLKGIEEGEKVALNLKLNEKAKRIWFGNVAASFGNENFYNIRGNALNFGKKNKFFFLTNLNNIGVDTTGDIDNLIRPQRTNQPSSIGDDQNISPLLKLSPRRLNFEKSRTNFNNAELLSLNAIFNPAKNIKIRTLAFFVGDETNFIENSIIEVNTVDAGFVNREDFLLRNTKRIGFGKIDLTYTASKRSILEATTKYNTGQFLDRSDLEFNGVTSIQDLSHQNSLIDQKLIYTTKLNEGKALLFTGRFINESTPQTYSTNQFLFQELFPSEPNTDGVTQLSNNKLLYFGANVHLLDRKENGNLLEIQLGNEFRRDRLSTSLSLLDNETVLQEPSGFQNQTTYTVNDLYLKSKYRLELKDFGFTGELNFHQLVNQLDNNGTLLTENPFFINPSVGIDWKINQKNKIVLSYGLSTTNANLQNVFGDFVLTGFRSFSRGTGDFNQIQASNFAINHELGNWDERFFATTTIGYRRNKDFFSNNTIISQNFIQSDRIIIENQTFFNADTTLDYYLKFLASNLKLNFGYTEVDFKNIVNDSDLREIVSKNHKYGVGLRSGFKNFFNFHMGIDWSETAIRTSGVSSFANNTSFLDISFILSKKFNLEIESERYFFENLQENNTFHFLDFKATYKLPDNKISFSLTGKNLFNNLRFRNFSISDVSTSIREYRLLPRFFLLKMEYRF